MAQCAQEQQHLAQAERHLKTANHCLARQLHALSTLGSRGANLTLAESLFETMLRTHALMTEHKEQIERALTNCPPKKGTKSKRQACSPHSDVTVLLSKSKLRTSKSERGTSCYQ